MTNNNKEIFDDETKLRLANVYNEIFAEHLTLQQYLNNCILPFGAIEPLNKWLNEKELEINVTIAASILGYIKSDPWAITNFDGENK